MRLCRLSAALRMRPHSGSGRCCPSCLRPGIALQRIRRSDAAANPEPACRRRVVRLRPRRPARSSATTRLAPPRVSPACRPRGGDAFTQVRALPPRRASACCSSQPHQLRTLVLRGDSIARPRTSGCRAARRRARCVAVRLSAILRRACAGNRPDVLTTVLVCATHSSPISTPTSQR
jgi:hypothetical protein